MEGYIIVRSSILTNVLLSQHYEHVVMQSEPDIIHYTLIPKLTRKYNTLVIHFNTSLF